MAKSTATAALASLQHKFQAKIREVGSLKATIKRLTSTTATEVATSEIVERLTVEVKRLRLRNDNLANDLVKAEKALSLSEFSVAQSDAAYRRLESHVQDADGVAHALKADVASWKGFVVIASVVSAAAGSLATVAYFAQTAGM